MTRAERARRALPAANAVRIAIAELKVEVKAGDILMDDALEDERAQRMRIYDLLRAQEGWGEKKCTRLLRDLRISHTRRVEDLTTRERAVIGDRVKYWR